MPVDLDSYVAEIVRKPRSRWAAYAKNLLKPFLLSGLSPSAGYFGIWLRDAAFILRAWITLGEAKQGIISCQRLWRNRITESSVVVVGRSGTTFIPSKIADAKFKRKFKGLLPTTIFKGCLEVYGAEPDIDSTALMIETTCRLLQRVDSQSQRTALLPAVVEAANRLAVKDVDGDLVLEQGPNEDWMDTAYRSGKVLYSNACWLSALKALAETAKDRDNWLDLYRQTLRAVVKTFGLDSGEPSGVVGPKEYRHHVWQDMILAAVHVQPDGLLSKLSTTLNANIGPRVVYPGLPRSSWRSRRWGVYHNGAFWPWFSSIHASLLHEAGEREAAWKMMENVLRHCMYEWVEPTTGGARGPRPFRTGCATAVACLAEFRDGGQ